MPAQDDPGFVTRPVAELFGQPPGYGSVGAGVNTATGNYSRTDIDLRLPGAFLDWTRTYNSRDETAGPMGAGWTPGFSARLVVADTGAVLLRADDAREFTFLPDGSGGYRRPADLDADLVRAADGRFTLRFTSGDVWSFDASGRLSERQTEGERVTLEYDDERLAGVSHSAGPALRLSYDGNGRLIRVEAGDGRAVSYGYADSGALGTITGPDGAVSTVETGPDGRLSAVLDPQGARVVSNTYDELGRVTHQDLAGGAGLDLAYEEATGATTVILNPGGVRTVFRHDPAGHVTGLTDALGNSASVGYDETGRVTGAMTPGGTRIAVTYDARGNVATRSYGGTVTSYEHDDQDRVLRRTDPVGGVLGFEYSGDGRIPVAVTDPNGGVTRFTVVDGLIRRRVDPDGGAVSYDYDQARNVVAVTDEVGRTTRYDYDAAGRRTEVVSPLGETTRFEYDAADRLTAVTDPSGARRGYGYSANGMLTEVVDPSGAVTRFSYDDAGRRTATVDPDGRTTRQDYDPTGNLTLVVSPGGGETSAAYDALGRVTAVTDPTGATTGYEYDPDGRPLAQREPAGITTTRYDERGNAVERTDSDGAVVRYRFDAGDRPVEMTDPAGGVWRRQYDDGGRLVVTTDPTGASTTRVWTPAGRLAALTDPLGRTTRYRYDAAGRLVKVIDPMGGVTRHAYDPQGRRILTVSPAGLRTEFRYDGDRVAASIDPRGWITRYEYTADGDKSATIGPSGTVQRFEYDGSRRLTATTDPRRGVTRYTYDAAGNLASITDAKRATTTFAHDPADREISSTDPLGRTTSRAYDAAGNLESVTDPAGQALRMEYDPVGRLTRMTGADGSSVSYTYDPAGRRTSMTDATGTTTYAYNARGDLITVTEPDGGVLTARYDAAGQRAGLRYPDGAEVGYDYDLNGRLVRLRDPQAGEAVYALDPDGRLLTEQLPHRWARRYGYQGGLLTHFTELRDNKPVIETGIERDADGRVVTLRDRDATYEFRYDPAGQLVHGERHGSGTGPNALSGRDADEFDIEYDAVGNRTSITRGGAETRYAYDAADQLVTARTGRDQVRFRYDESGRLVERSGDGERRDIRYDGLGRPATVELGERDDQEVLEHIYNGDGLLAALTITRGHDRDRGGSQAAGGTRPPTLSVRYRWSVGDTLPQILAQAVEVDQPRALTGGESAEDASARFSYGQGRTFATTAHGSVTFARDAFGSAVRTEQTAPWAQAPAYQPFGEPVPEPSARDGRPPAPQPPRFGYRGELARGSAVYLRARFYDAAVGRFTTRDPVSQLGGFSQAANPYVYADNDPLDLIDPLGTFGISALIGAFLEQLIALLQDPCALCPGDPGNSIESHQKCFQGKACLYTRGFITEEALDGDPYELNRLWNDRQPERAAQAFTIHELNWRRQGIARSLWDIIGGSTAISQQVDWEVGQRGQVPGGFRTDIITSEHNLMEVKRYTGPSTVTQVESQLSHYISMVRIRYSGMSLTRSDELKDWADGFKVTTSFWNRLTGGSTVYVWGLGNLPGHIYFAKDKKANDRVRARVDAKDIQVPPLVPIPIPIPVRPPVVVP